MASRRTIRVDERRARLGIRHRLARDRRINDVVTIANDLVGLHSTDPVTVYLAAAARMTDQNLESVAAAMYDDRSLVRHHAMRRTLWVFTPELARIAHASTTAALAEKERTKLLRQIEASGVTTDSVGWLRRACDETVAVLEHRGPMTARQLGPLIPALRTPLVIAPGTNLAVTVAAHTRILLYLGFDGRLVRTRPSGSWINGEYAWAPMHTWLAGGGFGELDRSEAAGQLAVRWLHSFGPAPASDLKWWTGWSAGATTAAIARAGAVEVDLAGQTGWLLPDDSEEVAQTEPWVALLPGLDPTTMGWKLRDWYVAAEHTRLLFDRNGNAGPTIWADGQVVGGWMQRKNGEIVLRLLSPVGRDARRAIDAAAADLQRLLGDVRFSVRFPNLLQAELAAATPG